MLINKLLISSKQIFLLEDPHIKFAKILRIYDLFKWSWISFQNVPISTKNNITIVNSDEAMDNLLQKLEAQTFHQFRVVSIDVECVTKLDASQWSYFPHLPTHHDYVGKFARFISIANPFGLVSIIDCSKISNDSFQKFENFLFHEETFVVMFGAYEDLWSIHLTFGKKLPDMPKTQKYSKFIRRQGILANLRVFDLQVLLTMVKNNPICSNLWRKSGINLNRYGLWDLGRTLLGLDLKSFELKIANHEWATYWNNKLTDDKVTYMMLDALVTIGCFFALHRSKLTFSPNLSKNSSDFCPKEAIIQSVSELISENTDIENLYATKVSELACFVKNLECRSNNETHTLLKSEKCETEYVRYMPGIFPNLVTFNIAPEDKILSKSLSDEPDSSNKNFVDEDLFFAPIQLKLCYNEPNINELPKIVSSPDFSENRTTLDALPKNYSSNNIKNLIKSTSEMNLNDTTAISCINLRAYSSGVSQPPPPSITPPICHAAPNVETMVPLALYEKAVEEKGFYRAKLQATEAKVSELLAENEKLRKHIGLLANSSKPNVTDTNSSKPKISDTNSSKPDVVAKHNYPSTKPKNSSKHESDNHSSGRRDHSPPCSSRSRTVVESDRSNTSSTRPKSPVKTSRPLKSLVVHSRPTRSDWEVNFDDPLFFNQYCYHTRDFRDGRTNPRFDRVKQAYRHIHDKFRFGTDPKPKRFSEIEGLVTKIEHSYEFWLRKMSRDEAEATTKCLLQAFALELSKVERYTSDALFAAMEMAKDIMSCIHRFHSGEGAVENSSNHNSSNRNSSNHNSSNPNSSNQTRSKRTKENSSSACSSKDEAATSSGTSSSKSQQEAARSPIPKTPRYNPSSQSEGELLDDD